MTMFKNDQSIVSNRDLFEKKKKNEINVRRATTIKSNQIDMNYCTLMFLINL